MTDSSGHHDLSAEVINALNEGRKIEAIKLLRLEKNMGLKEAKEAVELFIESDPVIKEKIRQNSNGGCLGWIISFILICIGAYFVINSD